MIVARTHHEHESVNQIAQVQEPGWNQLVRVSSPRAPYQAPPRFTIRVTCHLRHGASNLFWQGLRWKDQMTPFCCSRPNLDRWLWIKAVQSHEVFVE